MANVEQELALVRLENNDNMEFNINLDQHSDTSASDEGMGSEANFSSSESSNSSASSADEASTDMDE